MWGWAWANLLHYITPDVRENNESIARPEGAMEMQSKCKFVNTMVHPRNGSLIHNWASFHQLQPPSLLTATTKRIPPSPHFVSWVSYAHIFSTLPLSLESGGYTDHKFLATMHCLLHKCYMYCVLHCLCTRGSNTDVWTGSLPQCPN